MYEQIKGDILFIMFYAMVMAVAMMACCYLLFRRANAIAPDVTPPVRLRRWTAAFFASMTLSHVWYMPIIGLTSSEAILMTRHVGCLLDSMTLFPLAIVILFVMLQDRRRPLWPVSLMVAPLMAGMAWGATSLSNAMMPLVRAYLLLLGIGLTIYMLRATRQYGRWLRDNYADLEHKEVWQSFVVLAVILFIFGIYALGIEGLAYQYVIQINDIVLVCFLLWRVETLSDLGNSQRQSNPADETVTEDMEDNALSISIHNNIEPLLQKYCIDAQLYLQRDLTVSQLAQAVGINRLYLSKYFSRQGMSYNAYINNLRIQHFVNLYHEAVAARRSFTAQQLAHDSGFQSYSTFSLAFKQRMGQSVTAWMRNPDK